MVVDRLFFAAAWMAAGVALSSCGGGGGGGTTSPPVVTPSPTPAALSASPSTLSFTGAQQTQNVAVSESAYQGAFLVDASKCANLVTVSPSSVSGPQATFSVTSVAAGTCSVYVIDYSGQKAAVNVTVTTGSGSVQ